MAVLTKIIWVFLSPGNLLVLLLLMGGFLGLSHNEKSRAFGRVLCFNIALLFFFVGIFPVGDWMLVPLENSFKAADPAHVDGIILIGGDEAPLFTIQRHEPVMLESARRFIAFAQLAREHPEAKLVYSGGFASMADDAAGISEARVAERALANLGIPASRVTFEDHSRSTRENALMSAALVHPAPDQKWLLVTSAYHMPRALMTFRKAGWTIDPAAAGYLTGGEVSSRLVFNVGEHLYKMALAAHEYYGLIGYWVLGYTDHPWLR